MYEYAEFEMIRVIDAVVRAGAAGGSGERWCLLCSEYLLYLVLFRFSNRRFIIVEFEVAEDSKSE